jgi:hypothetical protein
MVPSRRQIARLGAAAGRMYGLISELVAVAGRREELATIPLGGAGLNRAGQRRRWKVLTV